MSSSPRRIFNYQVKPKYSNEQSKGNELKQKNYRGSSTESIQRKNEVEQKTYSPKTTYKQNFQFSPSRQKTEQDQVRQKQIDHASPQRIQKNFEKLKSVSIQQDFKAGKQINKSQYQLNQEQVQIKNIETIQMNSQRSSTKPSGTNQRQILIQKQPQKSLNNQVQQQKTEQKTSPQKSSEKKNESISKKDEIKNYKKQNENPSLTPRLVIQKTSLTPPNQKQIQTCRGKSQSNHLNSQTQKLNVLLSHVIKPMFKDARYYITSVIHFLKEQYFPNTAPYKLQFGLEFQDQQHYFRKKFCDHFFINFTNVKLCQTLQQKTQIIPIQMDPPKQPKLSKNPTKTIIFDLDETLIHCNDINFDPTDHEVIVQVPNEQDQKVRFNIRPHCVPMLQTLSQFYELILFTASYKEYADKILEQIDPKNHFFSYRLYRDNCVTLTDGRLVKDLRVLGGRKMDSMVLVDNYAYCYFFQPDNGIPIIPFEDNKKDKELIYLTDYLIKCEKLTNWLEHHKHNFKNFIHYQCATFNECLRRII